MRNSNLDEPLQDMLCAQVLRKLHALPPKQGPILVAIDGQSGAGKSTLARHVAQACGAVVIEGDDFFCGTTEVSDSPPEVLAHNCIDWQGQRRVLSLLASGGSAKFAPFDWAKFDGSKGPQKSVPFGDIVILEGVYSARPELREMFDLSVFASCSEFQRVKRLTHREGEISAWESQWHRAEDWYFAELSPRSVFDLCIQTDAI